MAWNDFASDFIKDRLFLKPGIDKMRADAADKRLQQIKALRERRESERHRWNRDGSYRGSDTR